jgi:hypothetical protein
MSELLHEVLDYFISQTKPNENGEYPYLSRHTVKSLHESALVWKYGKKDWHKHLEIKRRRRGE